MFSAEERRSFFTIVDSVYAADKDEAAQEGPKAAQRAPASASAPQQPVQQEHEKEEGVLERLPTHVLARILGTALGGPGAAAAAAAPPAASSAAPGGRVVPRRASYGCTQPAGLGELVVTSTACR